MIPLVCRIAPAHPQPAGEHAQEWVVGHGIVVILGFVILIDVGEVVAKPLQLQTVGRRLFFGVGILHLYVVMVDLDKLLVFFARLIRGGVVSRQVWRLFELLGVAV